MALADYKITDAQMDASGVVSAPDTLTGTAAENKAVFDNLIRAVVAEAFNSLITTLTDTGGAAEIGAAAFEGVTATTVQGQIAEVQSNLTGLDQTDGAGKVGVTAFDGVTGPTAQDALEQLQANLAAYKAQLASQAGAALVGVAPFQGVAGTVLQTVLQEIQTEIDDIIAGQLPDLSVSWAKLSTEIQTMLTTALAKQDKLTGEQGQVVGFDESGAAVAQAAQSASTSPAAYLHALGENEMQSGTVPDSGAVEYHNPFSGTPLVLCWSGATLYEVADVTAFGFTGTAGANYLAVRYTGEVTTI